MKIKKIVSYLMAILIAVSLFAGTAVTASASASAFFMFSDTTAYAGEQAVVDVYLNASDLAGFRFEVNYDSSKLTLKNVERTQAFINTFSKNSPAFSFTKRTTTVLFAMGNPQAGIESFNGVALRMIFDVNASARGSANVAVSWTPSGSYDYPEITYYAYGQIIPSKFSNTPSCTVNILERVPLTGMSLNGDSFSLQPGEIKDLGALVTYTPSNASTKTIDWTSGNPGVATVDSNGKVKAVGFGTTTITGVSRDNPNLIVTATVTVAIPVSSVSLPSSLNVAVNKTKQLTPTITPSTATDTTVTWESSNPSVATVSPDGVVTGVASGTATITVTTNDGKKTSQCIVTVGTPATGLTVPSGTVNGVVGATTQISYSVTPSNSTDKPVFSSSDTKVAKVDSNGKITGIKAGTATITVKVGNISKSFKVTINNYVTLKIGSTKAIHNGTNTTVDKVGTKPFLVGGRTMIPMRFLGEKMGGKVKYISDKDPIVLTYNGITVSFKLNSKTMAVTAADGKTSTITLEVPAQKRSGKTYIPLRAVSQALGFTVYYQSSTDYIVVNNPKMGVALRDVRLKEAKGYLK